MEAFWDLLARVLIPQKDLSRFHSYRLTTIYRGLLSEFEAVRAYHGSSYPLFTAAPSPYPTSSAVHPGRIRFTYPRPPIGARLEKRVIKKWSRLNRSLCFHPYKASQPIRSPLSHSVGRWVTSYIRGSIPPSSNPV